jgi:hypothetical protein
MARKDNHYPVIRKFSVINNTGAPQTNGIVDVAQEMSKINHRLMRQSRMYEVSVTVDANVADGTTIDIYALADSWWTMKSLQMAKSAWDASNAEEKTMLNGKTARWNDFRVKPGLSATGGGGTGFDSLTAVQFENSTLSQIPFTAGEFELSTVVDQAGATRTFSWSSGVSATQYFIYDEYSKSSNTSTDPTTPAIGPYSGLLPNLDTGAAAALQDQGNNPPYNATGYGSGIWVKVGTLQLFAGRQRLSTGFFMAPCGFVALTGVGGLGADIQIECKRGDYKGVHAPSMLE